MAGTLCFYTLITPFGRVEGGFRSKSWHIHRIHLISLRIVQVWTCLMGHVELQPPAWQRRTEIRLLPKASRAATLWKPQKRRSAASRSLASVSMPPQNTNLSHFPQRAVFWLSDGFHSPTRVGGEHDSVPKLLFQHTVPVPGFRCKSHQRS